MGIAALVARGADQAHAETQVEILVEGDLRGRPSHGMQRLPTLAARIASGVLDPRAVPEVGHVAPGLVDVDGHHGFGPVAAFRAIEEIAAAAATVGIASAAIRRSGHVGMLAPYVERLAADGLIGIGLTTSEALAHPAGGRTAMVGTNPIGIAIPVAGEPVVLDMSTAAVSAGEIIAHAQRREPLAPGLAIGPTGVPTTDPDEARAGAISPFGGAKGYALAVCFELVVAALSRTAVGTDVAGTLDEDKPSTKGDVFVAIDGRRFGAGAEVEQLLAGYLDDLRQAPRAPGVDRILIPGDRMREERRRRLADGIDYPKELWEQLLMLAGAGHDA